MLVCAAWRQNQPQRPIAAAKLELRALTTSSVHILKNPKQVIRVSEEMIADVAPETVTVPTKQEFVSNSAVGGKVHIVLAKGDDIHPRQ